MNIKNKGCLFCFLAGMLLFFTALRQYSYIADQKNQISIRDKDCQLTAKMIDRYYENCRQEKKAAVLSDPSVPNVTLWNEVKGVKAASGDYYEEEGYTLIEGYGDLDKILPGDLMNGGYPTKNDASGCALSKEGARALFGSSNVLGKEVEIQKKTYIIRAVIDWDEKYLWIQNPDVSGFQNAELFYRSKLPQASDGHKFLAQAGVLDEPVVITWNVYRAFHRLLLSLPLWVIWIMWIHWCSVKIKKIRTKTIRIAVRLSLFILAAAGTMAGLSVSFTFGMDYIPAGWSDFTFYQNKWNMLKEAHKAAESLPYYPGDASMFLHSRMAAFFSAASTICILLSAAAKHGSSSSKEKRR